jgi:hypothetical protein
MTYFGRKGGSHSSSGGRGLSGTMLGPRGRGPVTPLSGFMDALDIFGGGGLSLFNAGPFDLIKKYASVDQVACINKANQSSQVARIDAATERLAKNWRPASSKFSVADVQGMASFIATENVKAKIPLVSAPYSTSDARTVVLQAQDDLAKNDERVQAWIAAVNQAKAAKATAIDVPGFKDDVLHSLVRISQAYATRAVLDCNLTWLDAAAAAVEAGVDRAMRIASLVVQLGEKIIKAAGAPFDIISWLGKYGPVSAVGLGALYIFRKTRK